MMGRMRDLVYLRAVFFCEMNASIQVIGRIRGYASDLVHRSRCASYGKDNRLFMS